MLTIGCLISSFAASAPAAVFNVDAGGVIADATATPTTTPFTFTVTDNFTVTAISLQFSASHSFVGDLKVVLQSPLGTQRELFSNLGRIGGSENTWFQDIVFTDSASTRIGAVVDTNPYVGNYKAQQVTGDLSGFIGENSLGVWTLFVTDTAPPDSGYLYRVGDNSNTLPSAQTRFGIAAGTALTVVPEPSEYATVFGLVALGVVIIHRRIKKTA